MYYVSQLNDSFYKNVSQLEIFDINVATFKNNMRRHVLQLSSVNVLKIKKKIKIIEQK